MDKLQTHTLAHLKALVACDTQNPPRDIDGSGIFTYCQQHLPGFTVQIHDYGHGAQTLLAVRGKPEMVFNVHLDTVPAGEHWSLDPFSLTVTDDKVYGLGACDIKGAAAALLAVANATDQDMALLFCTDEEAGGSHAIRGFLNSDHPFKATLIAEPTQCKAVSAHRGYCSAKVTFSGIAGHSSDPRSLTDNAIHRATEWIQQALAYTREQADVSAFGLKGLRFNVGSVTGGIKNNIIAPSARLTFGMRVLPGQVPDTLLAKLRSLAPEDHISSWDIAMADPALPAGDNPEQAMRISTSLAETWGLPLSETVEFWTEASLFSAAGIPALVYGPGDIAQAHTADEWVTVDQLAEYVQQIFRMVAGGDTHAVC